MMHKYINLATIDYSFNLYKFDENINITYCIPGNGLIIELLVADIFSFSELLVADIHTVVVKLIPPFSFLFNDILGGFLFNLNQKSFNELH